MRRAGPTLAPKRHSVGSSQVADECPLHFQRIDRADLAGRRLFRPERPPACRGPGPGPFLVSGLGERVVVTCLEDVIGRRDVVLLEEPGRLGLLLRIVEVDRHEPERAAPAHPVIVTNSGKSATHGPHQVAQTLITVSLGPESFTNCIMTSTTLMALAVVRICGFASNESRFPPGWDQERVERLIAYYDELS